MKINIFDTYYPQFIESWSFDRGADAALELQRLLDFSFGTFDAYGRNLRHLGWNVRDIVLNANLQHDVIADPDVVFMQDLSINPPFRGRILAGQCSCPMPDERMLRGYDVIFSSFPHYIDRFERMGIKAVYNPLAFDPIVLERIQKTGCLPFVRDLDCVFVGGVGNPSHWRAGLETLEAVAAAIPTFKWWGYGVETLNTNSPLRATYQGEAWGLDMYRLLLRSKIVLNRHGEVAQGMTNNMRTFEATGCGALLLTERSLNLSQFFTQSEAAAYGSPEEAVQLIRHYLENDEMRAAIARNGQRRTMSDHTYLHRMKTVSDTLLEMLAA